VTLDELRAGFQRCRYVCGDEVVLPVHIALVLGRPLLVEGGPGVGKTEVAKALSQVLNLELVRLQCYQGLDDAKALYEWNYQKQILAMQVAPGEEAWRSDVFSEEFLLERPLLKAIRKADSCLLLVDEVDRADEEFEAFLLEVLSDFQVSVPELGTIKAKAPPVIVLTSNSTRQLSDALRRRCIYLFIDYPGPDRQREILLAKVPGISRRLADQVVLTLEGIRKELDLRKAPSTSECLDWAETLVRLGLDDLADPRVSQTLGAILKHRDDLRHLEAIPGIASKVCMR